MAKQIQEKQAYPLFQKTTLPNGVRVITESIPSVRSVSVGIWINTGSRDETDAESGISHFIEHMVFKGTSRRRMHHIAQRMESVGGYLNAFTSKEYTCYYARALDEHLERAIDAVCDLVLEPNFPEKEVEKEKDVILEEMKMYEDTPDDLIFDWTENVLYKDHALGRPIIGFPETVRSFSRSQLLHYVHRQYTPDRMVVAIAGNVEHEKAVALATKAVEKAQHRTGEHDREPVNGYHPAELVQVRPVQQAHFVLATRAYDIHNPRRLALSVLNTILGGGMSSLLNQNIREKHGYCYNIYSFMNLHSDTGDFGVYMGLDPSRVDRAQKLIFRELDKLVQRPMSARKLAQAKNQVKGAIMLGLESMSNRMMRIGRHEIYFERYMTLDEVIAEVGKVTAEAVQAVARELFVPEHFSRIVLLPQA